MSEQPMWATQTDAVTDADAQFLPDVGSLVSKGLNFAKGLIGGKKPNCPEPDKKAMKHLIEKKTQHRLKKGKKVANKSYNKEEKKVKKKLKKLKKSNAKLPDNLHPPNPIVVQSPPLPPLRI